MESDIPVKVQKAFVKLGFKPRRSGGFWEAKFVKNENESIFVDFSGTVYVHRGFNKRNGEYSPICVSSFEADTLAKVEVLVKPLLS